MRHSLPLAEGDRAHPTDEWPISAATQSEAQTWKLDCIPDDDSIIHAARGQPGVMGRPRYIHYIWKTEGWQWVSYLACRFGKGGTLSTTLVCQLGQQSLVSEDTWPGTIITRLFFKANLKNFPTKVFQLVIKFEASNWSRPTPFTDKQLRAQLRDWHLWHYTHVLEA